MDEPDWSSLELREVLAFAPPSSGFEKADYPWLVAVRVVMKGGGAGSGQAGEDGYAFLELYGEKDTGADIPVDKTGPEIA